MDWGHPWSIVASVRYPTARRRMMVLGKSLLLPLLAAGSAAVDISVSSSGGNRTSNIQYGIMEEVFCLPTGPGWHNSYMNRKSTIAATAGFTLN